MDTFQLLNLPSELILHIANHLPESTILSLMLSCRGLHNLLSSHLIMIDHQRTQGTRQLFYHIRNNLPVQDLAALCERNKISVHATSEFTDLTALHVATYYKRWNIVMWLLGDMKMDPNVQDDFGYTPLHICAAQGYTEIDTALLEAGADSGARATTKAGPKAEKWMKKEILSAPTKPWFIEPVWPPFV